MVRSLVALALLFALAGSGVTRSAQSRASYCTPTAFVPAGAWERDRLQGGPGLVLSGAGLMGMPYDTVLRWLRSHSAAPRRVRAGNLLILKATGGRIYSDQFYRNSQLASVREILIPPCASRSSIDALAPYARAADFVLFSGGDQAHYVPWKNSALIKAIRAVYARGGVVGGGSAGLAIQGEVVFDSVAADKVLPDDEDVATPDAVANPYERAVSFTTGMFDWPPMRNTITDTHFARRNRFGRLVAFMARALQDRLVRGPVIYGVAVDEGAALLVNASGVATLVARTRDEDGYRPTGAYILRGTRAYVPVGKPLHYSVDVVPITRRHARYDLIFKRGGGVPYRVTVNGARKPMYSRFPY